MPCLRMRARVRRFIMLYFTETNVDTPSTAHFRTFLKPGSKYAYKQKAEQDRSGGMASRAPA